MRRALKWAGGTVKLDGQRNPIQAQARLEAKGPA